MKTLQVDKIIAYNMGLKLLKKIFIPIIIIANYLVDVAGNYNYVSIKNY